MKRVLIIEAQVKRYRKPFYDRLYESLRKEGIPLRVAYSDPSPEESKKLDNCDLPPDYGTKVRAYWFCKGRLLFQPLFREIAAADLVVIDHANKFLWNHVLLSASLLNIKKVAFWGLGENLQADRSRVSEWYKRLTLNWVDGWFAYTAGTAEYLVKQGVPRSKVVAVQNSVDTRMIRDCARCLSPKARDRLRAELGIGVKAPTGIFVGMLHKVKSVPFLVEAGRRIRERIADFQLIVVGGGPHEAAVRHSAANDPWVHFVGPKFREEKAELLGIADAFLLPGRVGLAILDGFAAGLPLVATRLSIHGPEMEYLEEGRNGILAEFRPDAYAEAVIDLLLDRQKLKQLQAGARHSAEKYSIEAMVENFTSGIAQFLGGAHGEMVSLPWGERKGRSAKGVTTELATPAGKSQESD